MDAYNYLIEEYKPLILSIAKKFNNIEKEDLFQAGALGLKKAFDNYDETSATKFSTYAYKYIYGEMYNLIYKNSDLKITKDTLKLYKSIIKTYQLLTQKNNKIPTTLEIAMTLEVEESLINAVIISCQKAPSLDANYCDDKDIKEVINIEENVSLDDKIFLNDAINQLQEPEKTIIKQRYYNDLTQSEIAALLGISQVKVSRYEKKGIEKMRTLVKDCA
ncbi:MAG TPA: sigma-70 family RNA polymerase sigma factor [Bacilli bacterium]|nr:sigma-70 family RNA polymerase sigma factor [Bacilli bacterium]